MRSFWNYPQQQQQRDVSCVNNVSVFAEKDSNRLCWVLCQQSLFPVWRTNRKTPIGRRSNTGQHHFHVELQSAFAESWGLGWGGGGYLLHLSLHLSPISELNNSKTTEPVVEFNISNVDVRAKKLDVMKPVFSPHSFSSTAQVIYPAFMVSGWRTNISVSHSASSQVGNVATMFPSTQTERSWTPKFGGNDDCKGLKLLAKELKNKSSVVWLYWICVCVCVHLWKLP